MPMSVDLINLRKRVADAARLGVVSQNDKGIYEATLIQILNESERQKMRCNSLIEEFKRKAAQAEAQASAYSQVSSIIYNVINGYVLLAEKAEKEEEDIDKDRLQGLVTTLEDSGPSSRPVVTGLKVDAEDKSEASESKPESEAEHREEVEETAKPVKKGRRKVSKAQRKRG